MNPARIRRLVVAVFLGLFGLMARTAQAGDTTEKPTKQLNEACDLIHWPEGFGVILEPMQVPAFDLIMRQKSVSGSPTGSPTDIDRMLEFSAQHSIAPITETLPMSRVNDALDHLRSGKARDRIVLANDASSSF
jgi:D-arabinose 1-dehydrogenase-like Zn-dependent alcohol dehydrogenase